MKVSTLAGEPLLVDELSLIKTSPVRVKMNVRDPTKLKGFVTIFINKVGYEISFVSDKYKDKSAPYHPPPDFGDDGDGDEDESEVEDSDRKHRKKPDNDQKDIDKHMAGQEGKLSQTRNASDQKSVEGGQRTDVTLTKAIGQTMVMEEDLQCSYKEAW
jgi:hypothetical protein